MLIQPSERLNQYGLLVSSILFPGLVVSMSWPDMTDQLINILEEYPFLHLILYTITLIICSILFVEFPPGMFAPRLEKVLSIMMAILASAFIYPLFLFIITAACTVITMITPHVFISLWIFGISIRVRRTGRSEGEEGAR